MNNNATTIRSTRRLAAFTLVEVLVVVMIMGIAAALVVPQLLNAGSMTIQAASRMVMSDVLYAQNEAIARQTERRVVFDVDNNSYAVADDSGTTLSVPWMPSGYAIDFDADKRFAGVTLTAVDFGGTSTLAFDELGAPTAGGTIELSANTNQYRITVSAFTGRVTVEPF